MPTELQGEVVHPPLRKRSVKPKDVPEPTLDKKELAKRASEEKQRTNARTLLLKRHASFQAKLLQSEVVSPALLKAWESVKLALEKALVVQPQTVSKRKRSSEASTAPAKAKKSKCTDSELFTKRAISKMHAQDLLEQSTSFQSDDNSESEVCTWSAL
jgi:hypothetical protein